MIDICKNIINLVIMFINSLFAFQIEFSNGKSIDLGIIVVSFIFIVVVLFLIFKAVGLFIEKGDDE